MGGHGPRRRGELLHHRRARRQDRRGAGEQERAAPLPPQGQRPARDRRRLRRPLGHLPLARIGAEGRGPRRRGRSASGRSRAWRSARARRPTARPAASWRSACAPDRQGPRLRRRHHRVALARRRARAEAAVHLPGRPSRGLHLRAHLDGVRPRAGRLPGRHGVRGRRPTPSTATRSGLSPMAQTGRPARSPRSRWR